MLNSETIASPRLKQLYNTLKSASSGAIDAFWSEIAATSTPLIEPLPDAEDRSLVTFLWRDKGDAADVRLISLITGLQNNELQRIPDTDIWFRSEIVDRDIRATYQFHPISKASPPSPSRPFDSHIHDPLNPNTYTFEKDDEDPEGFELIRSVLTMPDAPLQPFNTSAPLDSHGSLRMHRLKSTVLENERRVWIYTPHGYDPEVKAGYPLLVVLDGTAFARMSPLCAILDNLIAAGQIPPVIAIMPCSLSMTIRFQELLLNDQFNAFLVQELMPWAHSSLHVSRDPDHVVMVGASAGGLAAAYAAFEHPDTFGNVLSLSGAFGFSPGFLSPDWQGEHEWLTRRIARSDRRSVRFYLSVGRLETQSLLDPRGGPNLVVANRHLRTILEIKGYDHWLHEFPGGHDMISWQGVLPHGLVKLLGG